MNSSKRVAVITGAASGIGLALVYACLKKNMAVVMADKATVLPELADKIRSETRGSILAVACDVTDPVDVSHLASETQKHFHRVDWLFNNAGISGHLAPVWELDTAHIRQVMDVNLHGMIHGIQAFLPFMFTQKHRSRIINMASFYGLCSGSHMAAYSMSKHAVLALSESLYFDLERLEKPVDVSVVCPSFASTSLLNTQKDNNKLQQMLGDLIARSRPAEDVAAHIVQEVENDVFYILPDKEVKDYCEQRTTAIIHQTRPHRHSLEKIVASLARRALSD